MAIADFAISDRAISAPEDGVVITVTVPGRVVVYAQQVNAAIIGEAPAGDVFVDAMAAGSAELAVAPAGGCAVFSAPTGGVTAGGFPLD